MPHMWGKGRRARRPRRRHRPPAAGAQGVEPAAEANAWGHATMPRMASVGLSMSWVISCGAACVPAPPPSARSLAAATSRSIGAMPQLVHGRCFAGVLERGADGGHFLQGLDLVGGDVDHAHQHVLALEQLHQLGRHVRMDASSETCLILLFASAGKISSYWRQESPSLLPVEVGLDAVAVADVHAGRALQAGDRALQRVDAPALDVVHVDVERRLVELDHVDAVLLQRAPG